MAYNSRQPRDRRGRWTETGAGARLGSQRQDFARALQHQPNGDNSGRSTVYAYLRDKDSPSGKAGSPYYVGVAGDVSRPYGVHGRTPVPADQRRIRMLRQNITHEQAREWEKFYIQKYGRRDISSGRQMLHNHTDGGEGAVGAVRKASTRAKISASNRDPSEDKRAKMRAAAKNRSAELRARVGEASRNMSAESRLKARAATAEANRARSGVASSQVRNNAIRHGVDPDVWVRLSSSQRRKALERSRQQGMSAAQYLAKMGAKWGV